MIQSLKHVSGARAVWDKSVNIMTYAGGWFNIKMPSYQYRKSHCGDKTILRPSYLHNGTPYTGKMMTSLYWIRGLVLFVARSSVAVVFTGMSLSSQRKVFNNRQTTSIRHTHSQNLNFSRLVLQLFCPTQWSQALNREWSCSWSSANRRPRWW